MPEVFSHSRLSSFEDCPKKYEFRYVQKIRRDTESIEGFVGKRVHEVLERLYRATAIGHVPTLAQVIHRYGALFDEHHDPERVKIVREETPVEEYKANGERGLSNYYRRHYPFDADETLGLEERVAFALDGSSRYRMQGFVDRISRARDGAIEIHDYKTGRWVPDQKKIDQDRQLALYQIGVTEKYGNEQPVRLVWHYVVRDQMRTSTRTPEQLDALRTDTASLIDRVRAATSFPPVKGKLCSWCEFRDICPAFAGESADDGAERADPAAAAPPTGRRGQLSMI
ncbi:MAG: RecB family exonuclease [Myxococcota bacterium]